MNIKNIKILFLLMCTALIFISCEEDSDSRFVADYESGWIQFLTETTGPIAMDGLDSDAALELPVRIEVPINDTDMAIDYNLVSVSGPDPNTIFPNMGQLLVPGGIYGTANINNPNIVFNLSNALSITESMVFDVVLNSTDREGVNVGINGSTRPTSHRITICPSLDSSTGAFLGDYNLTLTAAGNPFSAPFADGTVTLTEGANGSLSREFTTVYLPGFQADTMVVSFSFIGGNIIVDENLATDIGCASEILLGGDSANILSSPCGDDSITLNMLDFVGGSGGCGQADLELVITLTKI